jgi:hypothetical protein
MAAEACCFPVVMIGRVRDSGGGGRSTGVHLYRHVVGVLLWSVSVAASGGRQATRPIPKSTERAGKVAPLAPAFLSRRHGLFKPCRAQMPSAARRSVGLTRGRHRTPPLTVSVGRPVRWVV